MNNSIVFTTQSEIAGIPVNANIVLLLLVGVLLCSLLCVAAVFRNRGEILEKPVALFLCQIYLVLAALLQVASAGSNIISQVAGFLVLALGIASIFFRKSNFDAARYCIAFGAALAACALFLL